jgi:hypothetical protein
MLHPDVVQFLIGGGVEPMAHIDAQYFGAQRIA